MKHNGKHYKFKPVKTLHEIGEHVYYLPHADTFVKFDLGEPGWLRGRVQIELDNGRPGYGWARIADALNGEMLKLPISRIQDGYQLKELVTKLDEAVLEIYTEKLASTKRLLELLAVEKAQHEQAIATVKAFIESNK